MGGVGDQLHSPDGFWSGVIAEAVVAIECNHGLRDVLHPDADVLVHDMTHRY